MYTLRTSHFALRALRSSHSATPRYVDEGHALMMDRPKGTAKQPAKYAILPTFGQISNLLTPSKLRSHSVTENDGELTTDSLPENSNLSDHSQQLPPPSQSASPLSMNDFLVLFNQQKDMLQQMQAQISELKETKSQVTDVDGLRLDLRKFCAELQQTHKVEMGLEVERQVSVRVAPLQQELDAVKLELQQFRGKVESSPTSTSQQQSQPDVSNLESKVHRQPCSKQIKQIGQLGN